MSNETDKLLDLQIEVIQISIYCDIVKNLLLKHRSISVIKIISFSFFITTLIISKKPGNTGISRDIRTEFTTDLLLSD